MKKDLKNNSFLVLFPAIFLLLFFVFPRFASAAELHINCGGQDCPIPNDQTVPDTDHPWPIYIDGEATNYAITNGPPNNYILWSSTKGGFLVTDKCYLGQQLDSSGNSNLIAGGMWTSGDVGSWTKTVNFTDTQPVLNSCNNEPTSSDSAFVTFSVQPHVTVSFDAKMDDGAGELSLNNSAIHYNYSVPYSDWHREDIQSGASRFLLQQWWSAFFPAPPSSFPYLGYLPSGYDYAALVGITDQGGNNIWVGGVVSNKYINAGTDAFIGHYRNTRIKVLSNQASLGGTYTITPATSVTPGSNPLPSFLAPSNALNYTYYGMTAGIAVSQTYTITYIPGANETINSITTQLCGGGYPTESCDPPTTTSGASASKTINYGGLIIFTINLSVSAPTLALTPNPMSLTAEGITGDFTLVYDPDGSGPQSPQTVCSGGGCLLSGSTWSSSNTSAATVSSTGRITPIDNGFSTITATYSGLTAFATVNVSDGESIPTVDIKANGSDGPISISSGSSATISWTSASVSSCTVSPTGWTGTSNPGISTGSLTNSTIYSISCNSGAATDLVTVNVGVTPTLSVTLSAFPSSGFAPLNSTLSASVSGTATGTINYGFWWNCTSTLASMAGVSKACGSLPSPPAGSCSSNAAGYKCEAVNTNPQTVVHSYSSNSTAKVVVERGSATPAENRTSITILVNSPPAVSSVTVTQPDYCISGPAATVNWTYSDPESQPQSAYQVQVDDQGSFNSPEADSGKVLSSGTSYFASGLPFDKTMKARVRVWDSQDAVSGWTESSSWKTPKHAYPIVNFTWFPSNPVANQPVQFTDQTIFDPAENNGTGQRAWNWLFGDGGSSNTQNPNHTYLNFGLYNVTETVTDKDGFSCPLTKLINIDRPIPVWKEVSPK